MSVVNSDSEFGTPDGFHVNSNPKAFCKTKSTHITPLLYDKMYLQFECDICQELTRGIKRFGEPTLIAN